MTTQPTTQHGTTKPYRLRDPKMTNAAIAEHLRIGNELSDHDGSPTCYLIWGGKVVATRTKSDELVISNRLHQEIQARMTYIADEIPAREDEEIYS